MLWCLRWYKRAFIYTRHDDHRTADPAAQQEEEEVLRAPAHAHNTRSMAHCDIHPAPAAAVVRTHYTPAGDAAEARTRYTRPRNSAAAAEERAGPNLAAAPRGDLGTAAAVAGARSRG